jgi:hypothetical protein
MTFTVNSLTRCAGQNHYRLNITVGAQTFDLHLERSEMERDFADRDEAREALVDRLRSAVKEANANNFAQARAALEGNTFKV